MSQDEFTKLFKYMEKRFDAVERRFDKQDAKIDNLTGAVSDVGSPK